MPKFKEKIKNFLIWSQKYTHTDMVYLTKNAFWLSLGQFFNSVSSLILTIFLTKYLSKSDYGVYKYLISILNLFLIFSLPGINTAIIQAVSRGYENIIKQSLKTKIKYSFLGSSLCLIASFYYYFQNNHQLSLGILIIAVFLPFINSLLIYNSFLTGKKLFNILTKYQIIKNLIKTLILILNIIIFKNTLIILITLLLTETSINFVFHQLIFKKHKLNNKTDHDVIRYGKKLTLINLIGKLSNQLDKLLIFHFLGAQELAIYFIAISFPEQIKTIFKNIYSLALPKFSNKNLKNIKKTLYKKIGLNIIFLTLISLFYIILAQFLYKIFFPNYQQAIFYSQIFIISLIFSPLLILFNLLKAQKKEKEYLIFYLVSSSIHIISLLIGIKYKLIGIIIAKIFNRLINFIILLFLI